jgi:hypothetical protein
MSKSNLLLTPKTLFARTELDSILLRGTTKDGEDLIIWGLDNVREADCPCLLRVTNGNNTLLVTVSVEERDDGEVWVAVWMELEGPVVLRRYDLFKKVPSRPPEQIYEGSFIPLAPEPPRPLPTLEECELRNIKNQRKAS